MAGEALGEGDGEPLFSPSVSFCLWTLLSLGGLHRARVAHAQHTRITLAGSGHWWPLMGVRGDGDGGPDGLASEAGRDAG